jgi:TPR repeat protein
MSQSFVLDSSELAATKQDAEAGAVGAQFRLALHYQASGGVWSLDDETKWMRAAAAQDHQLAQFFYARLNISRDLPKSQQAFAASESLSMLNKLKNATVTTDKFTSSSTQLDTKNMESLQADIATCLHRMGYARASLAQHLLVANRSRSSTIRGRALMDASRLLLSGDGDLPIDERYALQLLEDATKLLPSEANLELGDLLLSGRDIYDPIRAISCYRSEMKREGNEIELLRLARMHAIGIGVAADKATALAFLQPLCDEDKAPAGDLGMWAAYCGFVSPGRAWKAHERVHELACNESNGDAQYCWAMAHLHGFLDRKKDTRVCHMHITCMYR